MTEYIYEHVPSGADHMGKPVELPTLVQREEIVRCRDCKRLRQDMSDHEYRSGWWCDLWRFDPEPDGFCARGERKVDSDERQAD